MAGGITGLLQALRLQLGLQEFIRLALVDQQRQALSGHRDQFAGIPLRPVRRVVAQVGVEGLLPPRHVAGRNDRRERRHAAVAPRVAQRDHQRTVTAHRVAADAARIGDREIRLDQCRQFLRHVVVHAVVLRPRCTGGIEVEPRPLAQVIALGIGHVIAAWAGIGRDDDHAMLGRVALRARLGDDVLLGAGQPAQPVQHRQFLRFRLRRQVHGELHVAAQRGGMMPVDVLPAAETGAVFNTFHGALLRGASAHACFW
ncbi:hypothetical protein PGKDCPLP_02285 [Stenotrophomonas maltophilia]|nr:hypothetical protein PGKDCPLP_02285 [Stenotrophomonas maltophilia]